MPDENRFAGLGEQIDPEEEAVTADQSADPIDDDVDEPERTGGPAFEFEATKAKSLYVRPETIELLEDIEFEVESILRRNHGLRDLTGREFHDALIRAVATNPEAIAELVLHERDD